MSRRELERELAEELRGLLLEMKVNETPEADLHAVIAAVRAARAGLGGTRRPRWFESLEGGRVGKGGNFNEFSLYRGMANPLSAKLDARFVTLADGRRVVEADVVCNELYEGPPHGVHGGYVAGLFDDVLGSTIRLVDGPSAVTGTLSVRYRRITPLDTPLRLRAWISHSSGRRIHAKATCHAGEVLTAEADALFVRIDMAALAERAPDYRADPASLHPQEGGERPGRA